jgi:response regulator RpfG family c-di-GMP phosphodiesterase
VDSCERDRIDEAADELSKVMKHETLKDSVLLVLANKQDSNLWDTNIPFMNGYEIEEKLNLWDIKQKWHLQLCSVKTGNGLYEGFNWLSKNI